jgi:hypothetical protein
LLLDPETYLIKLVKAGYVDQEKEVKVEAGKTPAINFDLVSTGVKSTTVGSLKVSTTPAYATLYVNGLNKGYSGTTLSGFVPGNYQVRVEKDGYLSQKVMVSSFPSQAEIYMDGEATGQVTPGTIYVEPDDYSFEVRKTQYTAAPRTVEVSGDNVEEKVHFEMTKRLTSAGKGMIKVNSKPSGADITLDGVSTGKQTFESFEVAPGTHTVLISKSGYVDYSTTVTVPADDFVEVGPILVKVAAGSAQRGETEYDTGTGTTSTTPATSEDTYVTPSGWVWSSTQGSSSGSNPPHDDVPAAYNPYA